MRVPGCWWWHVIANLGGMCLREKHVNTHNLDTMKACLPGAGMWQVPTAPLDDYSTRNDSRSRYFIYCGGGQNIEHQQSMLKRSSALQTHRLGAPLTVSKSDSLEAWWRVKDRQKQWESTEYWLAKMASLPGPTWSLSICQIKAWNLKLSEPSFRILAKLLSRLSMTLSSIHFGWVPIHFHPFFHKLQAFLSDALPISASQ